MGMGGMIDILFFACGIYLIWSAVMAKKRGNIAANVMLSKDASEKDIKDKIGYIEYMYKRLIVSGILIVAASIVHLVNDYYIRSSALTWVGIMGILIALVIYTTSYLRGQKRYMVQKRGQK